MQPLADGRIAVYTFKRGLLSKVAHDLRLRLEHFELRTDGERVEGDFWLDSLVVEGAMKNERFDPETLSDSDRRDILANVRSEILHVARYPIARFAGTATARTGGYQVNGELELHGQRAPIETTVERDRVRLRSKLELVPTRWGIEPYQALLGAIKLQDRVIVELDFAAPG